MGVPTDIMLAGMPAEQGALGAPRPSRVFLVCEVMERYLRALAADLPAAPGDPQAGARLVLNCEAIVVRLNGLSRRMDGGEDATAVPESATLLR